MLQHQRQKVQGGNLRMRHDLLISPIKCLFDTLWRHVEAKLRIELVKAREPMHTRRIQGPTEVEQHRINASEVHVWSLPSTVRLHQRYATRQRSATWRLDWRDWRDWHGERR